jgi:hypothetical protein
MDSKTVKQYQPYVDLIMLLDSLRSGKFVNPQELMKNLQYENFDSIVRTSVHEWDNILERLNLAFARKLPWIKLIEGLRWIEVPVLASYLSIVGLALFREIPWAVSLSFPITLVVFVYLAITRISLTIMVDQQAKKITEQFKSSMPRFSEKIRKAILQLILQFDAKLLSMNEGGSDFRIKVRNTDYPGLTFIVKPSRLGPELLDAFPFPLHVKLESAKSYVRIIMSRRDDKLIQALAEVPQSTLIELAVLRSIAIQKSWPKFTDALKKVHPRFSMVIYDSELKDVSVQVILKDSTWKLDMRQTSGYLRLPYLPVEDEVEKREYETRFASVWQSGEMKTLP